MRMVLAVACALLGVACGAASPTSPWQQGSLHLSAAISRSSIPAGQTATITFTLANTGSDALTLNFGDSCQIKPYISNAFGLVIYPAGGDWLCAMTVTSLTIAPGETKRQDVQVRAASSASYPYVALRTGSYLAFAKVTSGNYRLQSEALQFTVQ